MVIIKFPDYMQFSLKKIKAKKLMTWKDGRGLLNSFKFRKVKKSEKADNKDME